MMNFYDFFKEKSGKSSIMRAVYALWLVGILLVWGLVSYEKKEIQPLDNSLVVAIGILVTGKVTQRVSEKELESKIVE